MISEMIALMGPVATWVLLLGVLPAVVLVGAMWSLGRLVDWRTRLTAEGDRQTGALPGEGR